MNLKRKKTQYFKWDLEFLKGLFSSFAGEKKEVYLEMRPVQSEHLKVARFSFSFDMANKKMLRIKRFYK